MSTQRHPIIAVMTVLILTIALLPQVSPYLAAAPDDAAARRTRHPDWHVRSTPDNVTWGEFPSTKAPVLVIQSGQTVRIDTLSHAGATQGATLGAAPGNEANHPVAYLAQFGVKPNEVLKDVVDFWHSGQIGRAACRET